MLKKAGITGIEVFSRGVAATDGTPMTNEAQDALQTQGIDGKKHRATLLTPEDLERADLVLVMEEAHQRRIESQFPNSKSTVFLLKHYAGASSDESLEIEDPYGGSPSDYEKCRMEIQDSLLSLLSKFKSIDRGTKGSPS